ncbi:MAG: hypothetical protein HYZ71_09660 [Deltaproteobacteria bacterium]|nr:hypothetical protein [Deltaproteobacteria bacterium]
MDEATRGTIKQASEAAMFVGGVGVLNSHPIGTAGSVGYIMTSGDDYVTEMTFKCK